METGKITTCTYPFSVDCVSACASQNGVFTSPEIAKSFDFTSEERIYSWYHIAISFGLSIFLQSPPYDLIYFLDSSECIKPLLYLQYSLLGSCKLTMRTCFALLLTFVLQLDHLVQLLYARWESQGYFKPNFDKGGVPFVISMPPPNVTGSLHMGHAMFVTLEVVKVVYGHRINDLLSTC